MNLDQEKKNLQAVLANLDERIAPLKEMVLQTTNFELDYKLRSIKYIELILKQLDPKIEDHIEIQIDAALYIGETVRLETGGIWTIESDNDNGNYGQPCVFSNAIAVKRFYPLIDMRTFMKAPEIGFFMGLWQLENE